MGLRLIMSADGQVVDPPASAMELRMSVAVADMAAAQSASLGLAAATAGGAGGGAASVVAASLSASGIPGVSVAVVAGPQATPAAAAAFIPPLRYFALPPSLFHSASHLIPLH